MLGSTAVKAQGNAAAIPDELNRQILELYSSGKYEQAIPIAKKLLETTEREHGPAHPDTATSLNNLAALYQAMGAYGQAEPLLQRALAIREQALGPAHPDTAQSLNNLAALYRAMGAYGQAEPLYQRALAIFEKALGPAHPNTAQSLNNLAELYGATGAYAKAEPLLQRALAISEKALGPAHPNMATILSNLAALSWTQGRWSKAKDGFRRGVQIEESNAQGILALGDESRKRAYIETLTGSTHGVVTFYLAARGKVADADSLGLQVVLQRKGRVLDVMADTYSSVRHSLSAQDRQLFDQWREANARYAALLFRGPETMPAQQYRALLDELKSKIEALEVQLSQRSAEFRTQTETVTVERVQRAIPADAALIEWFHYHPLNPKPKGQEQKWGTARYVAYVLKRAGQRVAVDLGEVTSIESTLSDLLVALRVRTTRWAGSLPTSSISS
jgi:tetratricopeptide (TPR) repeat protein